MVFQKPQGVLYRIYGTGRKPFIFLCLSGKKSGVLGKNIRMPTFKEEENLWEYIPTWPWRPKK
jgi:hypothetical protein